MTPWEEEFLKLVDSFVVETKDPRILDEVSQLDLESRLLGISFYDLCCMVLQDTGKHQNLVAELKTYMSLKKSSAFLV